MLYLIGLGLGEKGISLEGLETVKKCDKVYLEGYTVDFPYLRGNLGRILDVNIEVWGREKVETEEIVEESRDKDVALLVYGSPLIATTHISLVRDASEKNVKYKVINSASVFDAVVESGLQFYKFGKVASMPQWDEKKNYRPDSFMEIVKDNKKIDAHSLILCDIGLKFSEALEQLKKASKNRGFSLDDKKLVVCESLGTEKEKFYYGEAEKLEKLNENNEIKNPFCLVIPGKFHHSEEEFVELFSI